MEVSEQEWQITERMRGKEDSAEAANGNKEREGPGKDQSSSKGSKKETQENAVGKIDGTPNAVALSNHRFGLFPFSPIYFPYMSGNFDPLIVVDFSFSKVCPHTLVVSLPVSPRCCRYIKVPR